MNNFAGLRLAVLAPIAWPTPPSGYGPWEQIAYNIAEGMHARGLDVTLFATGNSRFSGKLASVVPVGINEDPASGNAHVMLASYLVEMGQIGMQQTGFLGLQGRHMQRPSQIHVRLERDRSTLVAAHIGGHAVLVSEGTLSA